MRSAVAFGTVRHRRFTPAENAFTYRVAYFYLDLAEIPRLFRVPGLFGLETFGLYAFRRRDYLGDAARPLDECVRDAVAQATGRRPEGPVRMLTQVSSLGYCFNPVTFYYCFGPAGDAPEFIVAEITNTPWGERHRYVLPCAGQKSETFTFDKAFHISPFMGMDLRYRWLFTRPGERLLVHMDNLEKGAAERFFDATLDTALRPWTFWNVARALLFFPFMTMTTVFLIHMQALVLWLKRVPVHTHPQKETAR